MITVGDILDFVLANRKGKVFRGWTVPEIAAGIHDGIEDNTLLYAEHDNKVVGMILAVKFPEDKILFVTENLAMSLSTLKMFARRAKEMYPEWRLEAMRHDKHRKFNTDKLYSKLS